METQKELDSLGLSLTLVAAVVGAGFASGQEILRFFAVYQGDALWGLLGAGCLLSVGSAALSKWVSIRSPQDYGDIVAKAVGSGSLRRIMDGFILFMTFLGLSVTVAGLGALLAQVTGFPFPWAVTLAALGLAGLSLKDIPVLVSLSRVFVPILAGAILLIWWRVNGAAVPDTLLVVPDAILGPGEALAMGGLYAGYNLILITVALSGLGDRLGEMTPGGAAGGGMLAGFIITILMGLVTAILIPYIPDILHHEVPLAWLARALGPLPALLFQLLLGVAMVTTALAATFGLASRLRQRQFPRLDRPALAALLTLIATPLAYTGFSRLVAIVYPVMGLVGLVFAVVFLVRTSFNR